MLQVFYSWRFYTHAKETLTVRGYTPASLNYLQHAIHIPQYPLCTLHFYNAFYSSTSKFSTFNHFYYSVSLEEHPHKISTINSPHTYMSMIQSMYILLHQIETLPLYLFSTSYILTILLFYPVNFYQFILRCYFTSRWLKFHNIYVVHIIFQNIENAKLEPFIRSYILDTTPAYFIFYQQCRCYVLIDLIMSYSFFTI